MPENIESSPRGYEESRMNCDFFSGTGEVGNCELLVGIINNVPNPENFSGSPPLLSPQSCCLHELSRVKKSWHCRICNGSPGVMKPENYPIPDSVGNSTQCQETFLRQGFLHSLLHGRSVKPVCGFKPVGTSTPITQLEEQLFRQRLRKAVFWKLDTPKDKVGKMPRSEGHPAPL